MISNIEMTKPKKFWTIALSLTLALVFLIQPSNVTFAAETPSLPSQDEDGDQNNNEFVEVVVARVPIPIGTRLRLDYLTTELRPVNNIAVRGGYFFGSPEEVAGQIVKINIAQGQEILAPMLAISASDLPEIGSDLALHIDNGRIAVAVPIDVFSGASFAMRPGDFVDVLMSFELIELDLEFQTPLPNVTRLVDADALEEGEIFLLPAISQGRLELVPEIDRVVTTVPQGISSVDTIVRQIPRRTSQLTIQQAEVLWLDSWYHETQLDWEGPNNYSLAVEIENLERTYEALPAEEQDLLLVEYGIQAETLEDLASITRNRLIRFAPSIVILSLPLQDALTLKWATAEPGIDIDFVLRSQGDRAVFVTTAVNLPQLVEQAGLAIPEPAQFGLEPNIERFGDDRIDYEFVNFYEFRDPNRNDEPR